MDKLIEQFIINFGAKDIWAGFLMLAIFYILKKEPFKIFAHLNEQKNKDVFQAKSLLESEKLGKESNELLREHLENFAFKKFYGINANREMRSALLKFYNKHYNSIGWNDLRRAYPYIQKDSPSIKVHLPFISHLGRWAVTCLSWFIGLYALLVILVAFISKTENQLQFFGLTFLSLALLGAAMFFSSINWPFHSAVKIRDCSKKQKKSK